MKTSEQIAATAANSAGHRSSEEWERIYAAAIGAVEADRAQRRTSFDEIDHMLNAWESYDGDVSGFIGAWVDHLNDGAEVPDWAKA